MRLSQPLFRFDPGWLFIVAGLSLCVSGVLLPAQRDLHALRQQLIELEHERQLGNQRLQAHAKFLAELDRGEPDLTRRLAASQLNLIPAGDTPALLIANNDTVAIGQWIESTVPRTPPPASALPESRLSRWASGPHRLWLFGAGGLCVFIGLLTGPGPSRRDAGMAIAVETAAPMPRPRAGVPPIREDDHDLRIPPVRSPRRAEPDPEQEVEDNFSDGLFDSLAGHDEDWRGEVVVLPRPAERFTSAPRDADD